MTHLSIRTRLAAWYALSLLAGFGVLAVGGDAVVHRSIHTSVDEGLRNRAEGTRRFLQVQLPRVPVADVANEFREHVVLALGPGAGLVQVWEESAGFLYQASLFKEAALPPLGRREQTGDERFEEREIAGRPVRLMTTSTIIGERRFWIQLGTPTEDLERFLARLNYVFLGVAPVLLLMAAGGGYWLSGRALAPVDEIARTAHRISGQNLRERLPVLQTGDELARLTDTLNAMFDRIESAFDRVSRFAADASHELRTPLAIIRTTSEVTASRPRSPADYETALHQIREESVRMSHLVESLLALARSDRLVDPLDRQEIDVSALLGTWSNEARNMASSRQLTFSCTLPDRPIFVNGDAGSLRRVMTILTENATRYTPPAGQVAWRLRASRHEVVIEVADTGIGIEPADLSKVFERLYRSERARRHDPDGAGLGLAIAKWIVEQHGGTIRAASAPEGGCVVTVALPCSSRGIDGPDRARSS